MYPRKPSTSVEIRRPSLPSSTRLREKRENVRCHVVPRRTCCCALLNPCPRPQIPREQHLCPHLRPWVMVTRFHLRISPSPSFGTFFCHSSCTFLAKPSGGRGSFKSCLTFRMFLASRSPEVTSSITTYHLMTQLSTSCCDMRGGIHI